MDRLDMKTLRAGAMYGLLVSTLCMPWMVWVGAWLQILETIYDMNVNILFTCGLELHAVNYKEATHVNCSG